MEPLYISQIKSGTIVTNLMTINIPTTTVSKSTPMPTLTPKLLQLCRAPQHMGLTEEVIEDEFTLRSLSDLILEKVNAYARIGEYRPWIGLVQSYEESVPDLHKRVSYALHKILLYGNKQNNGGWGTQNTLTAYYHAVCVAILPSSLSIEQRLSLWVPPKYNVRTDEAICMAFNVAFSCADSFRIDKRWADLLYSVLKYGYCSMCTAEIGYKIANEKLEHEQLANEFKKYIGKGSGLVFDGTSAHANEEKKMSTPTSSETNQAPASDSSSSGAFVPLFIVFSFSFTFPSFTFPTSTIEKTPNRKRRRT